MPGPLFLSRFLRKGVDERGSRIVESIPAKSGYFAPIRGRRPPDIFNSNRISSPWRFTSVFQKMLLSWDFAVLWVTPHKSAASFSDRPSTKIDVSLASQGVSPHPRCNRSMGSSTSRQGSAPAARVGFCIPRIKSRREGLSGRIGARYPQLLLIVPWLSRRTFGVKILLNIDVG